MRITINIVRRDAAALTGVVREMNAIKTAASQAGGAITNWGTRFDAVTKFGKNLQWTGRQLEYRFTLPLVLAGAAVTKFAFDNERAMTRLSKVYGSAGEDQAMLQAELKKLGEAFRILSEIFGIHQSEVIEIAADWAAAGAAGAGLAKATRLTMEAMVLGEMEAAEATEALIVMTHAYQLSTEDLGKALAMFNMVENETAVRMSDLITVTQTVGGAAREAGVDLRHLAAMAAAMIPAAGSASEAANSLKTTIANVMAPTGEAADAFAALGVNINDLSWTTSNFDERLNLLAKGYANLDQNQKLVWARNVVNIRQISRLTILMNDLTAEQSRYNKALTITADEEKNRIQMQKEIGAVLASQPRAFQAMIVAIQNSLVQVILPILPVILSVLNEFRKLVAAFTELSPRTQKIVISLLAMLAILGPIVAYVGSFAILLGTLGRWAYDAGRAILFVATNPIALFIAALIAAGIVIWIFRDEIKAGLEQVGKDFLAFGKGVVNIMSAIWKGIVIVAQKIYDALSYLNPFARHSPSLVESVRAGVTTILDEYSKLSGIGQILRAVTEDVEAFARATDDIAILGSAASRAQDRSDLIGMGASPEAIAIFDRMTDRITELRSKLPLLQAEIDAQAVVVARWAAELKKVDAALKTAQARLDELSDIAAAARDELDAAKEVLSDLFSYNITGERAASDALFENEMAVKALRLELLRLEESGQTVEGVTDQLNKLSGEIEKMQALEKSLRLAGAGSEITGPIRAQIAALDAQRRAISSGTAGGGGRAAELQKQIEMLERQGEILELERSIKFDPLKRQLDLLKEGFKEMNFDELVAKIKAQQTQVGILTDRYETANKAVEEQRKVVDDLNTSRKVLSDVYDLESEKLEALRDAYDEVTRAIDDLESAVSSLKAAGGGADALGAPGDFEVPGGGGAIAREGGIEDIQKLIDQWLEELKGKFDKWDLLASVREKFNNFMEFLRTWRDRWNGFWTEVGNAWNSFTEGINTAWDSVTGAVGTAWDTVVGKTQEFWGKFNESIKPIKDELAKWGELWEPFKEATANLWTFIEPFLKLLVFHIGTKLRIIKEIFEGTWNTIWEFAGVFWESFVKSIAGFLEVLRGLFKVILGIFTLDWGLAWDGIKTIVHGAFEFFKGQWALVSGLFTEVIPAALRGVKDVFREVWEGAKELFDKVGEFFKGIWEEISKWIGKIVGPLDDVLGKIGKLKDLVGGLGGGITSARSLAEDLLRKQGITDPAEIERILREQGIIKAARGALIYPSPGGQLVRVGERGYAEAIVPLDAARGMKGGTTINIYGNLEFPNVSDGSDARGFVTNLKTLAV